MFAENDPLDIWLLYSYIMASMKFRIIFAPEAAQDFRALSARDRGLVRDGINAHLGAQPDKVSKSRIKRLRDLIQPQYRLRIGDIRVYYDLEGYDVLVLGIVTKADSEKWLTARGTPQ